MDDKRICAAVKKSDGRQCANRARTGSRYCGVHKAFEELSVPTTIHGHQFGVVIGYLRAAILKCDVRAAMSCAIELDLSAGNTVMRNRIADELIATFAEYTLNWPLTMRIASWFAAWMHDRDGPWARSYWLSIVRAVAEARKIRVVEIGALPRAAVDAYVHCVREGRDPVADVNAPRTGVLRGVIATIRAIQDCLPAGAQARGALDSMAAAFIYHWAEVEGDYLRVGEAPLISDWEANGAYIIYSAAPGNLAC